MRSVVRGIFLPVRRCREYTGGEKVNIWHGKRFSRAFLWDEVPATDLTKEVRELDLPAYFFQGVYDYTTSFTEARGDSCI